MALNMRVQLSAAPGRDTSLVLGDATVAHQLGPPVVRFYPFRGGRAPTKIVYSKKGTLILTSLLEDLVRY